MELRIEEAQAVQSSPQAVKAWGKVKQAFGDSKPGVRDAWREVKSSVKGSAKVHEVKGKITKIPTPSGTPRVGFGHRDAHQSVQHSLKEEKEKTRQLELDLKATFKSTLRSPSRANLSVVRLPEPELYADLCV